MDRSVVRLRLDIAYDGTDFHGWAVQGTSDSASGVRTVQGTIEEKLSLVLRVPVHLTVAGRTDAGVHAIGQVAHCDIPAESLAIRSVEGDPQRLVRRLARLLPRDVRVRAVSYAPEGFDARFSALRRHYVYRLTTSRSGPSPLRVRDTASFTKRLDVSAMNRFAADLVGLNDFAAFCRARPHATTVRDMQVFEWREVSTPWEDEVYEARVSADAFCWSMVRSLVGASLAVGEGRESVAFASFLLDQRERCARVPVAPACGLTLVGVDYPPDKELAHRAVFTRDMRAPVPL